MTISARRLLSWLAVIVASIVVTLACWQDPSYAQGQRPANTALSSAG
nr:hypothetical protein [Micromonospora sp. DSM 115978]